MITIVKRAVSRFIPIQAISSVLKVKKSKAQRCKIKTYCLILTLFLLLIGSIISFIKTNKSTLISMLMFETSIKKDKLNYFDFKIGFLVLILYLMLILLWLFTHSKYSFLKKWQLQALLLGFTEETDLLRQHDSEVNLTKTVVWEYHIKNGEYFISLKAGGHTANNLEDDLARRLLAYFVKETTEVWYIENNYIQNGIIYIVLSHKTDDRIIIDSLNKFNQSETLNIPLTKRLSWTYKAPMGLVVGPTGTGKTSLLKVLILGFMANNTQNEVFCIDGKDSFLGVSMQKIGEVATSPDSALEMVQKLENIMNKRYEEMNEDEENESDRTHVEIFHKGNILLVIDELLALVATMQAEDKERKVSNRLYPKFYKSLLNLIVKARAASITVLISGQMIPTSILPSEARDSLGLRIALGRISQAQATEIFNRSLSELPRVNTNDYRGLIWLDNMNLENPIEFITPFYDESQLPFKSTLKKLSKQKVT